MERITTPKRNPTAIWLTVFAIGFVLFFIIGTIQTRGAVPPLYGANLVEVIVSILCFYLGKAQLAVFPGLKGIPSLFAAIFFLIVSCRMLTCRDDLAKTSKEYRELRSDRRLLFFRSFIALSILCNGLMGSLFFDVSKIARILAVIGAVLYLIYLFVQLRFGSERLYFVSLQVSAIGLALSVSGLSLFLFQNNLFPAVVYPEYAVDALEFLLTGHGPILTLILVFAVILVLLVLAILLFAFMARYYYSLRLPILLTSIFILILYTLKASDDTIVVPDTIKYWVFLLSMGVYWFFHLPKKQKRLLFFPVYLACVFFLYALPHTLFRLYPLFTSSFENLIAKAPETRDQVLSKLYSLPLLSKFSSIENLSWAFLLVVVLITTIPALMMLWRHRKQVLAKEHVSAEASPAMALFLFLTVLTGVLILGFDFPYAFFSILGYGLLILGLLGFVLSTALCLIRKEKKALGMHLRNVIFALVLFPLLFLFSDTIKIVLFAVLAGYVAFSTVIAFFTGYQPNEKQQKFAAGVAFADTINYIDGAVSGGFISEAEGSAFAMDAIDLARNAGLFD